MIQQSAVDSALVTHDFESELDCKLEGFLPFKNAQMGGFGTGFDCFSSQFYL